MVMQMGSSKGETNNKQFHRIESNRNYPRIESNRFLLCRIAQHYLLPWSIAAQLDSTQAYLKMVAERLRNTVGYMGKE